MQQVVCKSQVHPLFLNERFRYDELYIANFFFNRNMRLIMDELPWGMRVRERMIIRSARTSKMYAHQTREALQLLRGLDAIQGEYVEEWHIAWTFDEIFSRQHRISEKYLRRFYNRATRRTFFDLAYELESQEELEDRVRFRETLAMRSTKFIASFPQRSDISAYMSKLHEPTKHRYLTYTATPFIPSSRVIRLYLSILATVFHVRGITLEVLYEQEIPFTPFSLFGIGLDDFSELTKHLPGIVHDHGVVWIVDFYYGDVYNFVKTSLNQIKRRKL